MKQVVIENPVLNSPFEDPKRHFKFADEGVTDEIVEAIVRQRIALRRRGSYIGITSAGRCRMAGLLETEYQHESR